MPAPDHCPRSCCPHFCNPPPHWFTRYGSYLTAAHGSVQRYRCTACRTTFSDQSRSLHFFSKRRLPLFAIWLSLLEGASMRELARRYHTSPPTIQGAVLRLGRQAMAAQLQLLACLSARHCIVYDGLRSCLTSHDYPCDITTVVDPHGETILTMCHTVMRRGGTTTAAQQRRLKRKHQVWQPAERSMSRDIAGIHKEIWNYLRPTEGQPALIDTDEHPLYAAQLHRDPIAAHLLASAQLLHRRTPGSAPRTVANRLFAVNYIDRLLRHRLREHTRQSIAIARSATMQMHRAWVFAVDHNCLREYRVKQPQLGGHAQQGAVDERVVRHITAELFTRRIEARAVGVPPTIGRVWMGDLACPPVRWRVGQKSGGPRIPAYARRDLDAAYQHAA